MSDTVKTNWIYPPEWGGSPSDDQRQGWRRIVVQLLNDSDGTGESRVKKVDISELRGPGGWVPKRTVIEKIDYHMDGMGATLEWDRAPYAVIASLPDGGIGCIDWRDVGGKVDPGLNDNTGDILLTTNGEDALATYDITLTVRLKE